MLVFLWLEWCFMRWLICLTFLQAMTGGGGWPMSVWLTPDLKPFVGATYFAPEDQAGRPGFRTILTHISKQV